MGLTQRNFTDKPDQFEEFMVFTWNPALFSDDKQGFCSRYWSCSQAFCCTHLVLLVVSSELCLDPQCDGISLHKRRASPWKQNLSQVCMRIKCGLRCLYTWGAWRLSYIIKYISGLLFHKRNPQKLCVMAHAFLPQHLGGRHRSLWVQGKPNLQREFQKDSQNYTERLVSQKPKGKKNPQGKTSGDPCRKQKELPIEAWTQYCSAWPSGHPPIWVVWGKVEDSLLT